MRLQFTLAELLITMFLCSIALGLWLRMDEFNVKTMTGMALIAGLGLIAVFLKARNAYVATWFALLLLLPFNLLALQTALIGAYVSEGLTPTGLMICRIAGLLVMPMLWIGSYPSFVSEIVALPIWSLLEAMIFGGCLFAYRRRFPSAQRPDEQQGASSRFETGR